MQQGQILCVRKGSWPHALRCPSATHTGVMSIIGPRQQRAENCECQDEGRQEEKAEEVAELAADREDKSRETLKANKMSSVMSQ